MNIIKKYIDYLKDNPEGYWFKRKLFGWGWTPATWQGWLVVLAVVALISIIALLIDIGKISGEEAFVEFLIPLFFLVMMSLIVITRLKGEKPKWQFGFPKKKDETDIRNES